MVFTSLPLSFSTLITAFEARNEKDLTWSLVHRKTPDKDIRQHGEDDENHYDQEKIVKITIGIDNFIATSAKWQNMRWKIV